jgi:hypothetical protein
MNRTRIAAAVCTIFLGAGVAGCSSGSPAAPSQPVASAPAPVLVQQPPTAEVIARQLHGTNFTSKDIGDAKVLWGMTSGGTFWLDGEKYAVNTFTTRQALDEWLKVSMRFGVNPKWKTDTSVTYPSLLPH